MDAIQSSLFAIACPRQWVHHVQPRSTVLALLGLGDGAFCQPQVFYDLDLVTLMTGGFFQRLANCFIERIAHHEDLATEVKRIKQLPANQRYRAQISSPIDSVGQGALAHEAELIRATAGHASGRAVVTATSRGQGQGHEQRHMESHPPHKNVVECQKSDYPPQEQAAGGNKKRDVDRVHFPSLEVFIREFMETSTPVILTGVSPSAHHASLLSPLGLRLAEHVASQSLQMGMILAYFSSYQ